MTIDPEPDGVWYFDGNAGPGDSQADGWYITDRAGPFATGAPA